MTSISVELNTHYNMEGKTYDFDYIQKIIEDGFDYELPEKTLGLINRISRMVGAPSYIKTPIFHKSNRKHSTGEQQYMKKSHRKRRKQPKPMTDDEWNAVREFEETKMRKIRDGIEKDICLITQHLNKLTDDTYEMCLDEIYQVLDRVVGVANENDILIICKNIFEISSSNGFYSKIFAKLLGKVIHKYKDMETIFYDNYKDFMDYFQTFEYSDPDEDYDAFCECNRENEKRRSYAKCIANLVNEGIISNDEIIKYLNQFLLQFKENINTENKHYMAEQITEIISAIVNECYETVKGEDEFANEIMTNIIEISKMKRKNYPSLSSKCIFKMMDLVDIMK